MPDSFFSTSKPRKRKREDLSTKAGPSGHKNVRGPGKPIRAKDTKPANGVTKKRKTDVDEELSDEYNDGAGGIDDVDLRDDSGDDVVDSGEEDENETPAEKRLRLARLYLESVKEGLAEGEFDAAEIDKDLISARLKQDVLEHSGKVHLFISDSFDFTRTPTAVLRMKGHRFSVTSAVASQSGKHLFTSGKEGSIVKWNLLTGKKVAAFHKIRPSTSKGKGKGKAVFDAKIQGHTDEVLALAMSDDGKYLVSAGRDRCLGVWDAEKGEWIKGLGGHLSHRDVISALSFRKGTYQLYTASFDRTVKVYDLSPNVMGYVETLFGHQDHILALDSLRGETCVTVGGRDKTVRFWKIVDETQLVFRGGGRSRIREVLEGDLRGDHEGDEVEDDPGRSSEKTKQYVEGSVECVTMIDETTFVSGGDSGSLCLWSTQRKKPVFTYPLAHGLNEVHSETEGVIQTPRWITALASLRYSDIIASGSWEGDIRIWKLDPKLKSFSQVGVLPAPGVINSLQLLSPSKEFFQNASWVAARGDEGTVQINGKNVDQRQAGVRPVLLVAGVGQEHRLGRWLALKKGVVNGTIVFVISPRTVDHLPG